MNTNENPFERQNMRRHLVERQLEEFSKKIRNMHSYDDWRSTFNEKDDPSLMQQPRYEEVNTDTFGFNYETKAAFNKWAARRFSRLESENRYYKEEVVVLRKQRDELLDKITALMNEVNLLKTTGYFPDKYKEIERTTRYSTLDV